MAKISPMMQQYLDIKEKNKGSILFFRLGDFYEMFFEDAVVASKELDITLTGKNWGQEERAPMCGVPCHSAESYIGKLVSKGFRVAICEQVEEASATKGLVKREVIRIVTPGTICDTTVLDESKNNYIMAIYLGGGGYSIAFCDVSTGEFQATEFLEPESGNKIIDEIARISPAEIICNEGFLNHPISQEVNQKFNYFINSLDNRMFELDTAKSELLRHFKTKTLDGFGLSKKTLSVNCAGGLLWYLYETQKNNLEHISSLKYYELTDFMVLDSSSRRNLELTETMRDKSRKGSLLDVMDETKTAMGARLLRKWIEQPLWNVEQINRRLDGIEELKNDFMLRQDLKDILSTMRDFERILSRVVYKSANARDFLTMKRSIENIPKIKECLKDVKSDYLKNVYNKLDGLNDIYELIDKSIIDDPDVELPVSIRDGGIIREGFHSELDTYRNAKKKGTTWVDELVEGEREKTGIKNLKSGYNRVFGYYIEVTKSNTDSVPDYFIRKQTLTNYERYITAELKDLEELILDADDKIVAIEYDMFMKISNAVANEIERIQYCAYIISVIDVLQSLSEIAEKMNYVRPVVDNGNVVEIVEGRHPVVEKNMSTQFIANSCYLDNNDTRLAIITGPNMAGKSTYMRQTALIVLMAQVGSFVPATKAHIGVVDRIFTRVGAADDLSAGQSTFMVEMAEVANILNNATNKSLLILDEIGRGTSTFDGLSIAWSVLEYIADAKKIGAKTFFATHYHELSELEGKVDGVKNFCIEVKEKGEDIIFLRTIKRGGASHSYGVQVAKLAGLPKKVIDRSNEILRSLEENDIAKNQRSTQQFDKSGLECASGNTVENSVENETVTNNAQEEINNEKNILKDEILKELAELDLMSMSPLFCHEKLFELQKKLSEI